MERKANKKLVYPLVSGFVLIVGFLVCFFAIRLNILYSACFSLLGAGFGLIASRIACHLYEGDNEPKTWAINIYGLIAVGGWACAIVCRSWLFCNIWLTVCCSGLILCLGTRFLKDENNDGIPDIFQKPRKQLTKEYLYDTLLFKLKGDSLDQIIPDQERPLIIVDGQPVSVNEARALGWNSAADDAANYIDSLFKEK